jgi:histidinol-phosphate aminotransferase
LSRYPNGDYPPLREAIAEVHGLDPARIICGCGSDEILNLVCRAYAGPGDEVIHTAHGFAIYAIYARAVGATPVSVPETDITADVDAILGAVTPQTKIVFLANPNNPTGTYIPTSELARLRERLREDIVLVVDGAYAEFATAADYDSGLGLAVGTQNTVATRTFSKIYGLAAVRLGWGTAATSIIATLERLRAPFNVTLPAQLAGTAAVRDQAHIKKAQAHNTKWMGIALQRLRGLGLTVRGDQANFLLVEFPKTGPKTAPAADTFLRDRGIIVRRVDSYGLPHALRMSIGNDDDTAVLLDAVDAFMRQA